MIKFVTWKITSEQADKIKRFDIEVLNKVYFDNLQYIKRLSACIGRYKRIYSYFEDLVQQAYIMLPYCSFTDDKALTKSLCRLLRKTVFSRPCVSLDKPIGKGKKPDEENSNTLGDLIGVDGFKGTEFAEILPVDTEENLQSALNIITEQTALTKQQKDILTAIAFGVDFYNGIYEKEKVCSSF